MVPAEGDRIDIRTIPSHPPLLRGHGAAIAAARWDGEPPARGYLYLGELYIEEVRPHWPDAAKAQGEMASAPRP
jgi:hypothetical protein